MKVLYIDTSSSFLYAGIVENGILLVECQKYYAQDLSKEALPEIIKLFEISKVLPKQIDKIIVVNGPGSFTGIRIGITIAKVYAWSLNIPITTITSLEAMAISTHNHKYYVPMIDARRGYIYAAIYDDNYRPILSPQHIKLEKILQKLEDISDYIVITNDDIMMHGSKEQYKPDIVKIVNFFKEKEAINPHFINPSYLKLTEAEESRQ